MKKALKYIVMVAGILLFAFIVSIPIVNNYSAGAVKNELVKIPLPAATEYVEALSAAGKLTGNGNGMQYFGAILIKSKLSLDELESYYSAYREEDDDCLVEIQSGQQITVIEHDTLSFNTEIADGEQYYIVYSWGDGIPLYSELDIRGH